MDIKTLSNDESALVAKAKADLAAVNAKETAVTTWFAANWHYAVAIAVGALFLGAALGYRVGMHSHL